MLTGDAMKNRKAKKTVVDHDISLVTYNGGYYMTSRVSQYNQKSYTHRFVKRPHSS